VARQALRRGAASINIISRLEPFAVATGNQLLHKLGHKKTGSHLPVFLSQDGSEAIKRNRASATIHLFWASWLRQARWTM